MKCPFRWTTVFALAFVLTGTTFAEVNLVPGGEVDPDKLIILYLGAGGGGEDDGNPWPTVNGHMPPDRILNPAGGDKEPPDGWPAVTYNPAGYFEVFWSSHDGNDYEIVYAHWDGSGWTDPAPLTSNDHDDRDPDAAYAPDGTLRLTYWTDQGVETMTRTAGIWGAPEFVDVGVAPSIGIEADSSLGYERSNLATQLVDIVYGWKDASWQSSAIASTAFDGFNQSGTLDVRLSSEDGHTWMVWEQAPNTLGWCEISGGGCVGGVSYRVLTTLDEEERARFEIQMQVLTQP